LQHKKIRDKEIVVDYVGEKSSYTKKEEKQEQKPKVKDTKRLHIGGFDKTATEQDLKKLFTGFIEFNMPIKKDTKLNMGYGFSNKNNFNFFIYIYINNFLIYFFFFS
jgi:RNA recognition motif-containing protein